MKLTLLFALATLTASSSPAGAQPIQPPDAYPAPPVSPPSPPRGGLSPRPTYRPVPLTTTRITRPTAIFGDLLGRGLIYGVGFDHLINEYFGFGASFSYLSPAAFISPYANFYPVGGYRSALLLQAGVQLVYIGESNTDPFEELLWGGVEGLDVGGQASVGYEFRSGFLFRVMIMVMFNRNGAMPWPGLTFGGTF